MTSRSLQRLARMGAREAVWRVGRASRVGIDRALATLRRPQWVRPAEAESAHREISARIAESRRFVIAPSRRADLAARILRECPHSARHAAARADRILFGEYDLLGYRGLRFDASGRFEWNYDPVHDRRAPVRFWSVVPYLDPSSGDHKIIWELNRHQHWLALGRAYWLTGDRKYRERCLAELASWLDANPPLTGINWTSMLELAFRCLSWVWALHFFADPAIDDATPWSVDLLLALDRQLAHVEHNLSYYFSPNTHLTGEALALYVAGRTLPLLPRSAHRADLGRRVLIAEIDRQIARDGGHCERSTHYHRYTHDFYALALVVARITDDPAAPTFARALGRLAFATRVLADDTGTLPHIGDDDGGGLLPLTGRRFDDVRDSLAVAAALLDRHDLQIGSTPEEAFWWLANPLFNVAVFRNQSSIPSVALEDTGYYVSRSDDGTHVLVDGGPHGYQNCGHAHADALALTLTVRNRPLLVDPGAGCYTIDPDVRDRLRSTPLHNTVTIGDASQSLPDGPFHWARTTDGKVVRWRANDGFDYFDGLHDGYAPTVHRRRVLSLHHDMVLVADYIDGAATRAALHWHLDPRWHAEVDGSCVTLSAAGDRIGMFLVGETIERCHGDDATGLGWYSPAYGRLEPTTTLRTVHAATAPFWFVTVIDVNRENPVLRVDAVPIWAEAGAIAHGTAVRITRTTATDYALIVEPKAPAAGSWRVAELETDARMLFCRMEKERTVTRLALVDGSFARTSARKGLQLVLPAVAPDVHLDLHPMAHGSRGGDPENSVARITGPTLGARLVVNGREHQVTRERRASPRT